MGALKITLIQHVNYGDEKMEDFLYDWQVAVSEVGDGMAQTVIVQLLETQLNQSMAIRVEFLALQKRPDELKTQEAYLQLLRNHIAYQHFYMN